MSESSNQEDLERAGATLHALRGDGPGLDDFKARFSGALAIERAEREKVVPLSRAVSRRRLAGLAAAAVFVAGSAAATVGAPELARLWQERVMNAPAEASSPSAAPATNQGQSQTRPPSAASRVGPPDPQGEEPVVEDTRPEAPRVRPDLGRSPVRSESKSQAIQSEPPKPNDGSRASRSPDQSATPQADSVASPRAGSEVSASSGSSPTPRMRPQIHVSDKEPRSGAQSSASEEPGKTTQARDSTPRDERDEAREKRDSRQQQAETRQMRERKRSTPGNNPQH